jgi:hypothetical protein
MTGIRIPQKVRNNAIYILCFFSFFAAVFYNEFNLSHLPPDSIRVGGTVITNDDAGYLNPPRNYLKEGIWGEDYPGNVGRFIRPPGYGLVYLPFAYFFTESASVTALKIFQYLIFSFSVYWFFQILFLITKQRKLSFAVAAFYGISPFAVGFLSYTLTEGITPALVLYYTHLLLRALNAERKKQKDAYYFFASLVFGFLFITRPVLGIFGLLLPLFLIYDHRQQLKLLFTRMILFGTVAISFMLVWQMRNYNITGQYVGLHPIYHADNNTIYRAPFREYWNFAGGWAERGDKGFSYMVPMWDAAIKGDTSIRYIRNVLDSLPEEVVSYFGEMRLVNIFRNYQASVLEQKPFYDKGFPMPMKASALENSSVKDFRELSEEYKSEFPLQYYLISPAKVFSLLAFHSNLSLYIFQRTYRGIWWMEALRFISYFLHALCFLFIFLNMMRIRQETLISLIFALIPFIYLFYLCYFQRGVEERYTLPLLPLLMIGLVYAVWRLWKHSIQKTL